MDGEEVLAGRPALGGAQPGAGNEPGRAASGRGGEERPRASGRSHTGIDSKLEMRVNAGWTRRRGRRSERAERLLARRAWETAPRPRTREKQARVYPNMDAGASAAPRRGRQTSLGTTPRRPETGALPGHRRPERSGGDVEMPASRWND